MVLLDRIFCDKIFFKITQGIQILEKIISEKVFKWNINHLHPLIWVLNDLDAQSDFDKKIGHKKAGQVLSML